MSNHFHLLLETPEPNLVNGMRYLMGTFSQGWNARHQRRGHVFQGRYKSIPVSGERAADGSYFRFTADYIHLNPARARLLGSEPLTSYAWRSLPAHESGKGPKWLLMERVLEAFHLHLRHRRRKACVAYLQRRAEENGGDLGDEAMRELRKGHEMGTDKLLKFFLPSEQIGVAWGRASFEMVGSLEKIVGETGDLLPRDGDRQIIKILLAIRADWSSLGACGVRDGWSLGKNRW
jgi:hypothetical protein